MPTPALVLRSPSKINLHLRVAAPDASGFHPLRSWMITTTLHDDLNFSFHDGGGVHLTCDDPTLSCDPTNLVARAAAAVKIDQPSVAIHLTKRIPAGAGLGGGSSNAATALVGLNRLLTLEKSADELSTLAATLGSDVPFFLGASSAIAAGRGERLTPTPLPSIARYAVLILPPFAVSTAAAYRMLDEIRPVADAQTLAPFDAVGWSALPAVELLPHLVNDLEPAAYAIEPRLASLRQAVEGLLTRTVRMSGSGSTLFSLCNDPAEADFMVSRLIEQKIRAVAVELGKPSGFSD